MYQCPNCGGNLRFDIPTQQLMCDYCHTTQDPYAVTKDHDAVEENMYDVTVFTCPQCGGEILSTENSATGFCSFCGASTILDSRLRKEKRPNYIVPFKKTKEDCKKAYGKLMRHAIFAPKELKDAKCVDNFRGIYMPYWVYMVKQDSPVSLSGKKTYRRGNYIITDHYNLMCDVSAYYKGLSYDASSSFADNISEAIAPFDVRGMKQFTPSILCGFYADTSDVKSDIYLGDAMEIANEATMDVVENQKAFRGFSITTTPSAMSSSLHTKCELVDSAMFPVWFLSYRKGDRVAYATVNGQTGKVAADLPIDSRKYVFGSILLAVPIFLLLNLIFTVKPTTTLVIAAFIALITSIMYVSAMRKIHNRETLSDDRGYLFNKGGAKAARTITSKSATVKPENVGKWFVKNIFLFVFVGIFATSILQFLGSKLLLLGVTIGGIITAVIGFTSLNGMPKHNRLPWFIFSIAAIFTSVLISLAHPVSDLYYYGGTIFALAAVFFTILGIIKNYNVLSTRKLPQFNRTGGDDRA